MAGIEYEKIVAKLNAELYDQGETDFCFIYFTNGNCCGVLFNEYCLWEDQNDERLYDEEKDGYEDFEICLKRLLKEYIARLSRIKFGPVE